MNTTAEINGSFILYQRILYFTIYIDRLRTHDQGITFFVVILYVQPKSRMHTLDFIGIIDDISVAVAPNDSERDLQKLCITRVMKLKNII